MSTTIAYCPLVFRTYGLASFSTYFAAILFSLLAKDWIAGIAVVVISAVWHKLYTNNEPPVLALALTYQWIEVTSGIFYFALTGRSLSAAHTDFRPMVLIGLGCISVLLFGISIGSQVSHSNPKECAPIESYIAFKKLIIAYIISIPLVSLLAKLAWELPMLTQPILALTMLRYGLLFLVIRRLISPRFNLKLILLILFIEIVIGFTGFFAGFREPMIITMIALLEKFESKKIQHWFLIILIGLFMLAFALLWTGIKSEYRSQYDRLGESRTARIDTIKSLSVDWVNSDLKSIVLDLDHMVDRMWPIYYPSLAVSRVPAYLPHEEGAILWGAIRHIFFPRFLFPDKPELSSDSDMVRKYSNVWVAGSESGTSIAFGYAAESYIDFGLPIMFIPVFIYGLLVGIAYSWFSKRINNRELLAIFLLIFCWFSLYQFERSWVKTVGLAGTLIMYIGGLTIIVDMLIKRKMKARLFNT